MNNFNDLRQALCEMLEDINERLAGINADTKSCYPAPTELNAEHADPPAPNAPDNTPE